MADATRVNARSGIAPRLIRRHRRMHFENLPVAGGEGDRMLDAGQRRRTGQHGQAGCRRTRRRRLDRVGIVGFSPTARAALAGA